ncbi:GRB2-associated-binding protein 2 [Cricetulus griseus]|uniref:GRB2-associated-binding protein 2 n=1 Tax=Cricetulus griseus TaxID=10029 RepID=A0A061I1S8_CRIGR|nr:GRB2-associated-binding protein 2 [Cricetulus griseus]
MLRKLLKKSEKSTSEESLLHELLQSDETDVVCTGWLEKSLPEKKLGHYACKKFWFILRSSKMCGDPDVLEYYKNEHCKKPLGIINLNFCTQLDVALTFNKQELQQRFMFDIIINEHTFYLVAETEADRNRWVQSICQICSFSQTKESTEALKNLSLVSHNLCSSAAEFSSFSQPLLLAGSTADSEDMYTFKVPRNTLCGEFGDLPVDSALAPPPNPKTPHGGSLQQIAPVSDYKYPTRGEETACLSAKSLEKTIVGQSDSASSDCNYMPISQGSDIPMSTMPHHFTSRRSEILKLVRKAKSVPLDLCNSTVINELTFKSFVTKSWSTFNHTFNPRSSKYCFWVSHTDSGDSEENCVPLQNPMSSSPVSSVTNNPAPKKSTGDANYIALHFQALSPRPHHKPSTSLSHQMRKENMSK